MNKGINLKKTHITFEKHVHVLMKVLLQSAWMQVTGTNNECFVKVGMFYPSNNEYIALNPGECTQVIRMYVTTEASSSFLTRHSVLFRPADFLCASWLSCRVRISLQPRRNHTTQSVARQPIIISASRI